MIIKNLKLNSFRNFNTALLDFSDDVNVFFGNNGSGKTNILEAIFVLLLARSPRGASDSIMVNDKAEYYRLEGEIETGGQRHEIASAYQKGGRKKIMIDKVNDKASELFNLCTAVSTAPNDIEILSGSPSKRRDFINVYLAQASSRYLSNLTDYQKALAQKNAFLKQNDNGGETPYDDLMVQYGSSIMLARKNFLEALGSSAKIDYGAISGGQELNIEYKPSVTMESGIMDVETIKKAFREKLNRYRDREAIIQTAMIGPHRDDIEFYIRDYPARSHGSQGELRSAAISLKLAVFSYLKDIKKQTPILLLDEIFAELDSNRKNMLVELFGKFGQIFLTTASTVPESLSARACRFKIENGTAKPE